MDASRRFRVRKVGGQRNPHHVLTVPAEIVRLLDTDQEFQVELTDDGILFRAVSADEAAKTDLPPWLRKQRKARPHR